MMKLASVAVVGLVAMGCQAQAPLPPQSPQGGAMSAPRGGGPEMMGHHHEGPGGSGFHHDGGEAWEHHEGPGGPGFHHDGGGRDEHHCDAGDERMAPREHRGGHDMPRPGHERPGKQPGGGQGEMRELSALGVHFYPPPMLIRRAKKIGLTPDQMTKIRQEMLDAQAHTVDLHAKIEHAKIGVARLLSAEKIDQHAVDAQIDEAAKAEGEVHKLHLGTMLRVRALLTPEQRQKLDEPKPKREGPKPGMGAAGRTPGAVGEVDDDDDDDDDDEDADG